MGGGSEDCFAWLALRLAQGKVREGTAAIALLALLGLRSWAMVGCWG
jgi:hypothetical protein